MTLREILEKCASLSIYEKRNANDEYSEVVFFNKELIEWSKVLSENLGPASKPAGTKPSKDDLHLTKEYGGIFANQTLFKKEFDNATIIAMLWPWSDEEHTTLKMAILRK